MKRSQLEFSRNLVFLLSITVGEFYGVQGMLTREEQLIVAIDSALTLKRSRLSAWEIKFLDKVRLGYIRGTALSEKQKAVVLPIVKRIGLQNL